MSDDILVGDKPLRSLRVVDLKDELKKRGIRTSGTKSQLQQLLFTAINSEKHDESVDIDSLQTENVVSPQPQPQPQPTNDQSINVANNDDYNSTSGDKVASISINEEKETIKLTIRSSPRKSEPVPPPEKESDTEESQSEPESGSEDSPKNTGAQIVEESSTLNVDVSQDTKESTDDSKSLINSDFPGESKGLGKNVDDPSLQKSLKDESKSDENSTQPEHRAEKEYVPENKEVSGEKTTQSENKMKRKFTPEKEVSGEKTAQPEHNKVRRESVPEKEVSDVKANQLEQKTKRESIPEKGASDGKVTQHEQEAKNKNIPEKEVSDKKYNKKNETHISTKKYDSSGVKPIDSKNRATLRERLATQRSQDEGDASKPLQKKRRWGSSQTDLASNMKKGISSDELKQLINDSVVVTNETVNKVSKTSEDALDKSEKVDENPKTETYMFNEVKKVDISFKNTELNDNKILFKENSNIAEEENEKVRSISPAKNPESTVLFITGLVRPYTLMQLKKLLNKIGKIDEEKFWIDKIKSKCYVTYSTIEEAVETRKALHNLKWPQSSPKNLSVEYATLEDIDRCLNPQNYEDLPPEHLKMSVERKALENKNASKGKYDIVLKETKIEVKTQNKMETVPTRAIREWDKDKVNLNYQEEKEATDRAKKPRLSPSSPPPPASQRDKQTKPVEEQRTTRPERTKREESNQRNKPAKSESPGNLLEDLFRKTKASPHIYWLPLTEDQSIEKQKLRLQLERERDARIALRIETGPRRSPPMMRPINRRRSPPIRRRQPSYSPPPPMRRNTSRYSRSRSPDRRRFSPRRR